MTTLIVIKRDGSKVLFQQDRIVSAVLSAADKSRRSIKRYAPSNLLGCVEQL